MIDQSLRLERIMQEGADPECAVLLSTSSSDMGLTRIPRSELAPAIAAARESAQCGNRDLAVVVSLVGSRSDPQGRDSTAERFRAAGAERSLVQCRGCPDSCGPRRGAGR